MIAFPYRRLFAVVGLGTLGVAAGLDLAACSSPDGAGSTSGADSTCANQALEVVFSPMYSAYDGVHEFQIPAVVNGIQASAVHWTSSDPSMVKIAPDGDTGGVMITAQKAGMVTITASAGTLCGSSILTVTAAGPNDWDIGNARYNNGNALHFHHDGEDAGADMTDGGPACTSCHGPTATMGPFADVAHTPEQTGGFADQDLIQIVVYGNVPGWSADGVASATAGYFDPAIISYPRWHSFHQWSDITPDEQQGIVTYLRSLTPSSQGGSSNFGGHFGGDGGHHGGGGGGGGGNGPSPDAGQGGD